ncbi:uncharacterized protein LOC107607302 [Arachis ipaensis]|uniref:uncharacterized protein LOC107607302 n=1 Tax=Arachis ipaensis TaxID=130454 RepID=UPI000A2B6613|nr:uncharacterized protein LOC107607302 [Arachis ipaensis]
MFFLLRRWSLSPPACGYAEAPWERYTTDSMGVFGSALQKEKAFCIGTTWGNDQHMFDTMTEPTPIESNMSSFYGKNKNNTVISFSIWHFLDLPCRVNSYCLCPWCPCKVNARVSLNLKCKKLQVESCLKSKLNPTHLEVVDTSGGCGASFVVEIVSKEFEGKRLLERHQMVNAALEEKMKEIHALSVKKAVTPEQWKQLQQDSNQANPAA